jgi:galactokinase
MTRLTERFDQTFGHSDSLPRLFFAPGRVNLIGEHTDYTGGYVLPAALSYGTWALVRPRQDGLFRFASNGFDVTAEINVSGFAYSTQDDWANYPKGMIDQFMKRGYVPRGCDMLFHGNIPNGAGLSSSASIELVTGVAINSLEELDIQMIELVQMAQMAENSFVGVNCGIMDQFAVGMGRKGSAMMLKCDSLAYRYVPLDLEGYSLVITNSNKRRGLADSKYNERRAECEAGFEAIKPYTEAKTLGDVTLDEWRSVSDHVADGTIRRRLDHVITENTRVLSSIQALEAGDRVEFGRLMLASHVSLRDVFEVTGEHLDVLFEEACAVQGCIGTRMTGAGFGGCTVSLVRDDSVDVFKEKVKAGYEAKTGLVPDFYICEIGDGAREVGEVQEWQF